MISLSELILTDSTVLRTEPTRSRIATKKIRIFDIVLKEQNKEILVRITLKFFKIFWSGYIYKKKKRYNRIDFIHPSKKVKEICTRTVVIYSFIIFIYKLKSYEFHVLYTFIKVVTQVYIFIYSHRYICQWHLTLLTKQNFDLILFMSISLFDLCEHSMKNCENIIWIEIGYKKFLWVFY